jgi:hypothetical protein
MAFAFRDHDASSLRVWRCFGISSIHVASDFCPLLFLICMAGKQRLGGNNNSNSNGNKDKWKQAYLHQYTL